MKDAAAAGLQPASAQPVTPRVSLQAIFLAFLIIGATSFGGGVVAYLRNSLVTKHAWVTDVEFLEMMSISNALPGLNATNMSILVGNRLRGASGATLALIGMCVTSFVFMTVVGELYGAHANHPLVLAALKGSAAAAVGLVAATWYQLGRKSIRDSFDALVIVAGVLAINEFKLTVPEVLLGLGAISIFHHRPGNKPHAETETTWINFLH
jgi:chromate transporter